MNAANNFTSVTSTTSTVSTNAGSGYVLRAWSTQVMTHTQLSAYTISDWGGTNASPSTWTGNCISNSQCGFGYSTDDFTLTGGTASRFDGGGGTNNYAAFTHGDQNSNGDPVADETGFVQNSKHTIMYRVSVPQTQAAGVYNTTAVFIATPAF